MRQTKPKLTTVAYANRFEAEMAAQQRRFCDAFKTLAGCRTKRAGATVPVVAKWGPVSSARSTPCRARCNGGCGRIF